MTALSKRNLLGVAIARKIITTKLLEIRKLRKIKRNNKRFWVRGIYREREEKGEFHLLVNEMMLHDAEYFFQCFRMSRNTYEQFLTWVDPLIAKQCTKMRDPIGPSERLMGTLRYLVTGDAQSTIGASYRVSPTTMGRIINDSCAAIWTVLKREGEWGNIPEKESEWRNISQGFSTMWNFPHCLGALDG